MTQESERWHRIEAIFHEALEVDGPEREAVLDRECAGDAALRADVESLLRSSSQSTFLESPAAASLESECRSALFGTGSSIGPHDADVGRRIGPYRLVRLLGAGGMGAVFLGERDDDEYRGEVAVKLVRFGMSSDTLARRFRAERQTLARLRHPNIATLLDGGSLDDGRPYLVMEYVDGLRIDRYCDDHRATIAQRLRVFLGVCAAVQFAHRNLVVHRDLKPSNILVTDEGNAKLLDFGIAKLLGPSAVGEDYELTDPGLQPMTLEYASPEQIRGETVTTASDVYSLGVVLYELLTGHRPYALAGLERREAETRVLEMRPVRPSSVVARESDRTRPDGSRERLSPEQLSRARGLSPDRLRRRLGGDLDTIVLMALRKEPDRRYASAEQLAEDVDRYLRGLPVRARKDTFAYRASKYARRNAAAVVAATALAASLVFGLLWSWMQSREIARERDLAESARAEADEVTRFLIDVFEVADPRSGRGRDARAIDLLEQGAARLESDRDPSENPLVTAALAESIGSIFRNLGVYDRAGSMLERALAIREHELGRDDASVVRIVESLSELRRLEGRAADAVELARRVLAARRADPETDGALIVQALNGLGVAHRNNGDVEAAVTMLEEARDRLADLSPRRPDLAAATYNNLAAAAVSRGRYEEANEHVGRALVAEASATSTESPAYASVLTTHGVVLQRLGLLERAEAVLRDALRIRLETHGEALPDTGVAMSHLGFVVGSLGRVDEAEGHLKEAISILEQVPTEHYVILAGARNNLAEILFTTGKYDEAEALYRESLDTIERALGKEHPDYASTLNNLGFIAETRGRLDAAERTYREVVAIDRRRLDARHPDLAVSVGNLARALHARRAFEEAEALYREAFEICEASLGAESPRTLRAAIQHALVLVDSGRSEEAEPMLLVAYRSIRDAFGEASSEATQARRALVYLYTVRGDDESAARWRDGAE